MMDSGGVDDREARRLRAGIPVAETRPTGRAGGTKSTLPAFAVLLDRTVILLCAGRHSGHDRREREHGDGTNSKLTHWMPSLICVLVTTLWSAALSNWKKVMPQKSN